MGTAVGNEVVSQGPNDAGHGHADSNGGQDNPEPRLSPKKEQRRAGRWKGRKSKNTQEHHRIAERIHPLGSLPIRSMACYDME